jgi:glycosyltransferase involved in cell wall biosynthesis
MISCIIPVKNEDPELLLKVIQNLTEDCSIFGLELIFVNDGSVNPDGTHWDIRNILPVNFDGTIRFVDNLEQHGVGYAFDRGFEESRGDIIVLAGADVFPQRYWLYYIRECVRDGEIGCGVSVGLQPGNYDINAEGLYLRYGAKILYTMTKDDLPKNSELRKDPNYSEIVACKWAPKQSDKPYEIDAVYGAFYWMKKEFYHRMHGFDTTAGQRYKGHAYWGHLESMISLKAKVYGGRCMMYPDFKVGHVFGRIDSTNVSNIRAVREDWHYWNRLWIAHTMLDDGLKDECLNHLKFCRCLSEAEAWIKRNWATVQEVRERNKREGKLISKP